MSGTYRDHILPMPRPFLGLRVAQLVVAIIVLGMSAYGLNYVSFDGFSLSLFTALATMILTVYIVVADIWVPVIYNYWAILGLDIFGVIFWLASFITMAVEASNFVVFFYDPYDFIFKRAPGLLKRDTTSPTTYKHVMGATAGMGGLEFLLFIITLVLTAIHLHRHRASGGHCMYNRGLARGSAGGPAPAHDTEMPVYGSEVKTAPHDGAAAPVQRTEPTNNAVV